jgi:peptide/nickel transport system ATP-binding protein
MTTNVLECVDVVQEFEVRGTRSGGGRAVVSAVDQVTFSVAKGETYAVVGETGSGKTTLARSILGAPPAASGKVTAGKVQMVFQNPFAALDPRWTVARSVAEPLQTLGVPRREARGQVAQALHEVGLAASRFAERYPHELSGGQAQRVAIARALVSRPDLVILDEPVTALDVLVQAQILRLLADLRERFGLTYLLISHDLGVVRTLAHRTGIMYLGRLCESAPTNELFERPAHPYTAALLSAIPPSLHDSSPGGVARTRVNLVGEQPSPMNPPSGCRFRTRCPRAEERCAVERPPMAEIAPGHEVACHFPMERSSR